MKFLNKVYKIISYFSLFMAILYFALWVLLGLFYILNGQLWWIKNIKQLLVLGLYPAGWMLIYIMASNPPSKK